ncbi:MAG: type II secretion system protein [Alphaproteobacteria bacterium]|nr:type II secretion system protein [Alphaproteobacteria bacterium]
MKKINNKNYVEGFTLVEISIVLLIIGILTGTILKGKSIIESVRIDSVINDIRTIQMAYNQYVNITSNKPNTTDFFKQLKSYELIESETFKKPRIGGSYSVMENNNHQYLQVDNLTEKQLISLKAKIKSNFGDDIVTTSGNSNTSIAVQID